MGPEPTESDLPLKLTCSRRRPSASLSQHPRFKLAFSPQRSISIANTRFNRCVQFIGATGLSLQPLSEVPKTRYFTDGLSEDLLGSLIANSGPFRLHYFPD